MNFDSVERKKQEKKKKSRSVTREISRLTKVYPVAGFEDPFVKLRVRGKYIYCVVLDPKKYDLELLDESEVDRVTESYWSFHKQYAYSVKEIFMNFPEQNQKQQEYVRYKRDQASELHQMRILQSELEKLKYIEKQYKKSASYIWLFGNTKKELSDRLQFMNRFRGLFQQMILERDHVEQIFNLLNNSGGMELYGSEEND
ncbi:hypothetical protein JZO77_03485 [Enterococcus hulanensis]|uniref:hypothetical protein n=1 Tax=Enterococcus hulanensis TaxID=2559929 RepID=UPI001A8E9018|nr:hypothetical protein [Enterococcus hulanensis]MBO0455801.1 hypothetical protein [Enterococcus hulanensis]